MILVSKTRMEKRMIIDIHTHTFPDKIAEKAVGKLAKMSNTTPFLSGRHIDLAASMKKYGIDYSVVLPVATSAQQVETINQVAIKTNEKTQETGILSFGGIHPDCENYKDIIKGLRREGVKGIKIHPVFQNTYFDDIKYMRILDCAESEGLITITHGGIDVSFPGLDFVTPKHVKPVIEELHPKKLILAHLGCWDCYGEFLEYLLGEDVYLDTSYSLTPESAKTMPEDVVLKIFKEHGADKILYGSDSPWSDQLESIEAVKKICSKSDGEKILGENARKLLNIE